MTIEAFSGRAWLQDYRIRRLSCAARGTLADLAALAAANGTSGVLNADGEGLGPRDLCRLFGVQRTLTARRHLEELVDAGLLDGTPDLVRALRIRSSAETANG